MNSSAHPVEQLSINLTHVNRIMEDWNDITQTPADAASLKAGLLYNANNNASLGTWRGLKSPSLASAVSHSKLSYLERVVLEIVESERMYVRDLRSIVENYLGKIIDTQELLLRPEQVSALFGNIEDIYELNSELLQDLDSCHNDPVAVARCFVDRSQDFDIYTQYCNNYPNSVAALTDCMRNKQLAKFFRERQEQIRHSLPLGSYLLKPVQRILKYHLLLQEIAKHFDLEQDGYEVVEEAIDTMTCVAWYINDMKRKHEHAVRLQEIQSLLINWKGPDLTTYGELVLEGTFRVHRVKNERTFFLFDKIFLITKRRGDHYVYKNHIPCSSLMLIESTRDSLCFTVTHYKHSKQQYNIQAKSGEEKRVWTHHIKRLILENHHAIIPQKAKEAILEMDSYYPSRYKYSPERLKKAWSYQQAEDIPQQARQGRRQSEPFHGKNSAKKLLDGLHSSTSQRNERRKSEPTKQILKQLSSKVGLKHADSDGALLEFGEPPQPSRSLSQQEEEQTFPQERPEELAESDGSEKEMGPEEEDEAEEEERLSKGHKTQERPKLCQSPENSEKTRIMEATVSVLKEQSAMELERAAEGSSYKEACPEENPSDPESTSPPESASADQHGVLHQNSDGLEPTENAEKPLSSEEEEEDEEEEEEDGNVSPPRSILPLSVLDQASIIAERFTSSLSRRSSLALEEGKGYLTPKQASQSGSVLSLDGSEKAICRNNGTNEPQNCSLPQEPPAEPSSACSELRSPGPVETDRSSCRRKESMLSQQDRLLLDKIKNYYDYAEHQDAGFSVRRRESLSYIPKGLVRNSVFRINSLPQPEPEQQARKRVGTSVGSKACRTASWILSNRSAIGPQTTCSEPGHEENPQPISEAEFRPSAEMLKVWEEMEKSGRQLWNGKADYEGRAGRANGQCAEPSLRNRLKGQENGFDLSESLLILEDEDLGAITEESPVPSPENKSPVDRAELSRVPWKLMQELRNYEPHECSPQLHPRIMRLAHLSEAELTEKMKNKVYHLARQYSLRIKGRKPDVHRQLTELEEEMKHNASSGQQEANKKGKGKRKPVLSLLNYEQVVLQESSPPTLLSSSSHGKSPKRFSFSPCSSSPRLTSSTSTVLRSPISPVIAEKFNWPDVQELRSKYSCQARAEKCRSLPVNRSRSAPEKMMDTDRMLEHQGSKENEKREKSQHGRTQSCRGAVRETSSDFLPKAHTCDAQERLCVTAEAPLENNHQVIVMEKLLGAAGEPDDSYVQIRSPTSREKISLKAVVERCKAYQDSEEYRKREEGLQEVVPQKTQLWWEKTDSNQQSLVKNLREKFQTLNPNS